MWLLIIMSMNSYSAIAVTEINNETACLQAVKQIEAKVGGSVPKYSAICVKKYVKKDE